MEETLGAGARAMRRHNMALVLRLITEVAPVSRVALAGRTGLTKATVSSLVGELIDATLVRDIGSAGVASTGGRPASLLESSHLGPLALGLQIDIDHAAGCLVDLGGRVRAREVRRLHVVRMTPEELVHALRPMLGRLLAVAVDAGRLVAGVGVGVPAVFEAVDDDAVLVWSPLPGWSDVDPHSLLSSALASLGAGGMSVWIGNDAACAARAEFRSGHADARIAVYVGGESEIGAAVLTEGALRSGPHSGGSGFGHAPLRPRGEWCPCGARGCLDRYAGRAPLLAAAGVPDQGLTRLAAGGRGGAPPAGDHGARAVAAAAGALGDALTPLLAALDPDLVVIGGRLGGLGAALLDPLRRRLASFLPGLAPRWPVRAGTLGPDAAMCGAALTILDRIVDDPLTWITEMLA